MRKLFKKVVTIASTALMLGTTVGMAAASAYPAPFVQNGAADVAIVVGANAALSDAVAATNIASDLSTELAAQTAEGGSGTTVAGTAWEAGTSSDKLEIGESIYDVSSYLDKDDLSILGDGEIINAKGTAKYNQYLYFNDTTSSMVNYTENDDDVIGDYWYIGSGYQIARYVLDFTTNLDSDTSSGSSGTLDDIEDEDINLLGKAYTITTAVNKSTGVELTLMSGANKATISSGEEITIGDYTISAVVSSSSAVQFTVNGQTVDKMAEGEIEPIPGTSDYIAVTDITYESFSGGLHQATFWVGADKILLKNGSAMEINANSLSGTDVLITSAHTDDVSISEISINMTADDTYYVPVDGKLSAIIEANGDEPGVLITKNWDIQFKGFETEDTEQIKVDYYSGDKKYKVTFENADGDSIEMPIFYTNNSGIYAGESDDKRLVFICNGTNATDPTITKNDYFVLSTNTALTASNNVKTYLVQYKGADDRNTNSPVAKFDIIGRGTKEVSVSTASGSLWGNRLSFDLGGVTFAFRNTTSAESDDFSLALNADSKYCGMAATTVVTSNFSTSLYMRTKYNALINITDTNYTQTESIAMAAGEGIGVGPSSSWFLNITVDDTNRDDDDNTLPETDLYIQFDNGTSSDAGATITKLPSTSLWLDDPSNSDKASYRTAYGVLIEETDGDSSPPSYVLTVPKNFLRPLVYVSSGEITVTKTGGSATELGSVTVFDNEASSVSGKNLIVVGGSCINSVAADLIGSAACSEAFTTATGISAGEALIKSYAKGSKVALLVAGYNAADTTKAATYLTNNNIDTTVGKALKVTSATEATAITETA